MEPLIDSIRECLDHVVVMNETRSGGTWFAASNMITARAVIFRLGGILRTVELGEKWPLPYSIDRGRCRNIQEAAQIVDGDWILEQGIVRSFG